MKTTEISVGFMNTANNLSCYRAGRMNIEKVTPNYLYKSNNFDLFVKKNHTCGSIE